MAVNNSSNLRQIDTDSGSAIVTAAVPNWEVVGGTGISTSASGNVITITNTAGASSLVQQVRTVSTTAASTSKTINLTGTTPTTANTDLLISATITPTSAANYLVFEFSCPHSINTDGISIFCLFQGTTFMKAYPFWNPGNAIQDAVTASFMYTQLAGTTSATTFNIYFASRSTAGTTRTLQNGSGTALLGGAGNTATTFIITEIAV